MKVSTAAIISDGPKLLLVRRPVGGDLSECWELPGGKVDAGETPEQAVQRELKEELGLDVQVEGIMGTSTFVHGGERYELQAFAVTAPASEIVLHEHTDLGWFTAEEAIGLRLAPSDRDLLIKLTGDRQTRV